MGSTHGTWLNKKRIEPKVYTRVRVGHVFKFGVSTRIFILQGPEEDQEAESELTVTELIELKKKKESLMTRLEDEDTLDEKHRPSETNPSQVQSEGVDWGMGEDAQDENPMSENPFAVIEEGNEDLFLDDPKKTLRGWFEREGYELEYNVIDDFTFQLIQMKIITHFRYLRSKKNRMHILFAVSICLSIRRQAPPS